MPVVAESVAGHTNYNDKLISFLTFVMHPRTYICGPGMKILFNKYSRAIISLLLLLVFTAKLTSGLAHGYFHVKKAASIEKNIEDDKNESEEDRDAPEKGKHLFSEYEVAACHQEHFFTIITRNHLHACYLHSLLQEPVRSITTPPPDLS